MLEELKERLCNANKDLVKHKLVILTWGNVSAIDWERGVVAIKPSGVSFKGLSPRDIVIVDLEGNIVEGKKPSCDTMTHLILYKNFKNIKAIVHTHSTYATTHAQAKKPILCFGAAHADYFYGKIPVTRDLTDDEIKNDYELNTGKVIVETFKKLRLHPDYCRACLVASHGPFIFGDSIENAIENAVVLEGIARMNLYSLNLTPTINEISKCLLDKHFLRKHGKNAYYGIFEGGRERSGVGK